LSSQQNALPRKGWKRHLEGWQVGAVSVGIALLAALLAVPREVPPDVLPLPRIDRQEQRRISALERVRAVEALQNPLPFDVRAVGEAFRRFGRAENDGRSAAAVTLQQELARLAAKARKAQGDAMLLRLRALQTHLFLGSLASWEAGGPVTSDLAELGGSLVRDATRLGWVDRDGRFIMSRIEREVLFRIRWARLAHVLDDHPFAPSLTDWRTYYRFLLEHAPRPGDTSAARQQALATLEVVGALEKRDPEYPALLARGVLLYEHGAYAAADRALGAHLLRFPEGPWRLRAQNYLTAARAKSRQGTQLILE